MAHIIDEDVFVIAYTLNDTMQSPVFVSAADATSADLALRLKHPGETLRIMVLSKLDGPALVGLGG